VEAETSIAEAELLVKAPEELIPEDSEQDKLPETTTSFKMTEELFRAAKNAEVGSIESFWSHALYRGVPIGGKLKKPTVHYCRSILTTEKVLKTYFAKEKILGFDIEWAPNAHKLDKARKNVSLVQVASEERIALFHLALYPKGPSDAPKNDLSELISPTLKKILEDPEITKVGVSIKADCTRIRSYLGIDTKGLFELSHLHKLVKFSKSKDFDLINRNLVSLAKQVQEHLHLPLFKGDVRMTDWSKPLALNQIMYAASDSYAALQLYHTLEMKRKALDPTPPLPYHAELGKPIRLAEGVEIPVEEDTKVSPDDVRLFLRTKQAQANLNKFDDTSIENVKLEDPDEPNTISKPNQFTSKSYSLLLDSAEKQVATFRPFGPKVKHSEAKRRNLRTYFIWIENPNLELSEIGAMLRSPPLSVRSVATMILEAVRLEHMPYEKRRLKAVLAAWRTMGAQYVVNLRYGDLEKACGYKLENFDGDAGKETILSIDQKKGELTSREQGLDLLL
jgi:hypothetical protein